MQGRYSVWSLYKSLDGFRFKVAGKAWPFHDLMRRVSRGRKWFGNRDVNLGNIALDDSYFVEANEDSKVRQLLAAMPLEHVPSPLGLLEVKKAGQWHEIRAETGVRPGVSGRDDLAVAYQIVVECLRLLADMGSAVPAEDV